MRKFSILILIFLTALVFLKTGCSDINNAPPAELTEGIKSVIPARGPYGAYILIGGKGFGTVQKVTFNGTQAQIETSSDTTILTRVPINATSGPIEVISNDGTMKSPPFTVDSTSTLFLAIQGIQPEVARHRDTIRIAGTGFRLPLERNKIFFNEIQTSPISVNDSILTATVPPNAESGLLAIVAEQDTAIGPEFTVIQHKIDGISPQSGLSGTEVTISGSDFSSESKENRVLFNGLEAKLNKSTGSELMAIVPEEASTGSVSVIVRQDTVVGPVFTVQTLNIAGIKPESGETGITVTMRGSGFSRKASENAVTFNGTEARVKSASESKLQVIVPPDATSGPVRITVDNATVKGPRFTVITPKPTIKNISPIEGPIGTKVTITGMNFAASASDNIVRINETKAKVQSASETELTTTVPDGATTGPVSVTVGGKTGQGPKFTVLQPKALQVVIKTNGSKIDEDGYMLSVSGRENESVKPNDEILFKDILENSVEVSLSGIAKNCTVAGENPRNVSLSVSDQTTTTFTINCTRGLNISSISPNVGRAGDIIEINGSGFSPEVRQNEVLFTNNVRAELSSASETMLKAIVPSDAQTGPITVNVEKETAKSKPFTVEQPRSLRIVAKTSGDKLDADGYTLSVSGQDKQTIKPNDEIQFNNLFDDQVEVELTGIANNCRVDGSNPRTVKLVSNETVITIFNIVCERPAPVITGINPESGPVGTEVTITGSGFSSTKADNNVAFTSGSGKVNATIKSATVAKLVVDVPSDATSGAVYVSVYGDKVKGPNFNVVTTGDIKINISTTGPDQDPNGYDIILDGGDPSSVDINDVVTFNSVAEGSYSIEIADIASNCMISQDRPNPYNVDVTAGETTSTDIDVVCEEANQPPAVSFTYACENLQCDFDGSGSSDSDGSIASYSWDYGEYGSGSGATSSHGYEVPGTYTVTLIVKDNEGASSSTSKDITVTHPQISGISPSSAPVGTEVTISGSGFSSTKADNDVLFTSGSGEINATIKSATKNQLVVDVPGDATTGPVYVSTYGYKVSGPTFTLEQSGAIQVNTTIEGTEQDTDGYTVTVSGAGSKSIPNVGSATFSGIYDNSVQVELTDVAANCRVDGDNPRIVSIAEGDLVSTSFNVDCTRDLRGQILYISDLKGNNDIFARDEQGNQIQQITETNSYEYLPKLSPDGLKIAYLDYAGGRQIFMIDSDGSDVKQITNSGYYSSFNWSPDGTKFVVSRSDNSDAPADIYTMDVDGGNLQNITNTLTDREAYPDWSADGSLIIYQGGNSNIISIKPNGTNKVQLTNGNSDSKPEWSPDGTKIVFVRDVSGTDKIHIMNADGTAAYELTPSSINERSPTWSPDGSKVAYSRKNDGYYSIYIYSVDYDDLLSSPYTPTDDISPHWNY